MRTTPRWNGVGRSRAMRGCWRKRRRGGPQIQNRPPVCIQQISSRTSRRVGAQTNSSCGRTGSARRTGCWCCSSWTGWAGRRRGVRRGPLRWSWAAARRRSSRSSRRRSVASCGRGAGWGSGRSRWSTTSGSRSGWARSWTPSPTRRRSGSPRISAPRRRRNGDGSRNRRRACNRGRMRSRRRASNRRRVWNRRRTCKRRRIRSRRNR